MPRRKPPTDEPLPGQLSFAELGLEAAVPGVFEPEQPPTEAAAPAATPSSARRRTPKAPAKPKKVAEPKPAAIAASTLVGRRDLGARQEAGALRPSLRLTAAPTPTASGTEELEELVRVLGVSARVAELVSARAHARAVARFDRGEGREDADGEDVHEEEQWAASVANEAGLTAQLGFLLLDRTHSEVKALLAALATDGASLSQLIHRGPAPVQPLLPRRTR